MSFWNQVRAEPVPLAARPVHGEVRVALLPGQREDAADGTPAGTAEQVRRQVVGEHVECRDDKPESAVRVGAGAPAADGGGRAAGRVERIHPARAIGESRQRAGDGRQAEHARPALARGLLGQVAGDPCYLAQRAGPLAERQHDAGAQGAAGRDQAGPADRDVIGRLAAQPHAVVAAHQDAFGWLGPAEVEYLAQRHAGRDLDHRWPADRPPDREQHGSGLVCRPGRGISSRPGQRQHGQLRERLRIGEQGGKAVHPAIAGPGLAAGGEGCLAVDRVHQGAALAGHEPVRHGHHDDQAPGSPGQR